MDTRFFRHHRFPGLPVLAVSALAALLLAACTPEEIVYSPANESNTGLRTITLSASCEASATKAAIADDLSFSWSAGDRIAVWAGSGTSGQFYFSEPYVSGNRYDVSLEGTRSGYAVYPASPDAFASEDGVSVFLPASYDLSGITDADWSPLPMIALNQEGEDLHFKHVCGLLRLTVRDLTSATTKIEVDLGHRITGLFAVADASNPGTEACKITTDDDAEAGLTFVTFTGFTVTAGRTVLNLPVPTGNFTEITVRKFAGDDDSATETYSSSEFSWNPGRAYGKKLLAFPVVWSVMGDFNYWSADLDMTETARNIWESPVFETRPMTNPDDNGFKFRMNHDYEQGEFWGRFSVYGEAFDAWPGSGNIQVGNYLDQNYRVSAKLDLSDPTDPKITVYDHNIWSIRGSFDDWTTDIDLEKIGTYLFKGTLTDIPDETEFKIRKNHNWDYNWGTDSTEPFRPEPKVVLPLHSNRNNIVIAEGGTYQVELNLYETMTVTLTKL